MIGIPVGIVFANASEWLIHKYWLHGLGRNKKSFWAFHWHDHHKTVRQLGHEDPAYRERLFRALDPQTKEALSLIGGAVAVAPLFPVAPFFVTTVVLSAANYYRVHKRSHLDPEWAKTHLPWHWDHHMGPNQDANWCVTWPLFDWVMGTREKWLNTDEEIASRPQREAYFAKKRRAFHDATGAADGRESDDSERLAA